MALAEKIVDTVQRWGDQMATADIVASIQADADYKENSIKGELTNLVRQGSLLRVKQGWYDVPERVAGDGAKERPIPANAEAGAGKQRDPIYNLTASMGDGSYEISDQIIGHVNGEEAMSRPGKDVFWIFVKGDSMGSTYQKMTMVPVLRFTPPRQQLREDDVYFFRLEGAMQIKRLQRLSNQRIRVISDSEHYPNEEIALDEGIDFELLGRVLV